MVTSTACICCRLVRQIPGHAPGPKVRRRRSIGRPHGIFSGIVVLLDAHMEYSQSPSFYRSPAWNIRRHCRSIGRPHGIFSVAV
eukprot:5334901-Pyramimonas_sp.AAC.1